MDYARGTDLNLTTALFLFKPCRKQSKSAGGRHSEKTSGSLDTALCCTSFIYAMCYSLSSLFEREAENK